MNADNLIRTRSDTDERGIVYYYPCKSVLVRVLIIGRGVTRMDADGNGTRSNADGRGGVWDAE